MKLFIFGKGRMGRAVADAAAARGHVVVGMCGRGDSQEAVDEADVCLDFSGSTAVLEHVRRAAEVGKSIVVGTTGSADIAAAGELAKAAGVGFLFAPNFSVGVWLFTQVAEEAMQLFSAYPDYDVSIQETHHRLKADRPSGTALLLGSTLLKRGVHKKRLDIDPEGVVEKDAIHIGSVRSGSHPGKHSVIFDGPADTITLTHEARSRSSFALGAVLAAEWLYGKQGIYTFDDAMRDLCEAAGRR